MIKTVLKSVLVVSCLAAPASAQTSTQQESSATQAAKVKSTDPLPGAPAPLTVFFDSGSSTVRSVDSGVLDKASRAYSEGKPIVMILTGTADRTGQAEGNLELSQRRAAAVLEGLIKRGIPADRFQVLAKGETDLPVPTDHGVSEPKNRRVDITWR
jgi:outer membrane protein OmpA-like peptidoglycan-associated protein